jgi:hypothetical protein
MCKIGQCISCFRIKRKEMEGIHLILELRWSIVLEKLNANLSVTLTMILLRPCSLDQLSSDLGKEFGKPGPQTSVNFSCGWLRMTDVGRPIGWPGRDCLTLKNALSVIRRKRLTTYCCHVCSLAKLGSSFCKKWGCRHLRHNPGSFLLMTGGTNRVKEWRGRFGRALTPS